MSLSQFVREISVSLSRITYTPIPFWLDMTMQELYEWADSVTKGRAEGGHGKGI